MIERPIIVDILANENLYAHSQMSYKIDKADASLFENSEVFTLNYPEEYIDKRVSYKTNNYGHRCDDFKKLDLNKTNILFAGCSATFGQGLPDNFRWSRKVYNSLDVPNKGDFHCLGIMGASVEILTTNIIKYCIEFGNPDIICISFPDFTRETLYDYDINKFRLKNHAKYGEENYWKITVDSEDTGYRLIVKFKQFYAILESYCISNGIKLYSTSWDIHTGNLGENLKFKTFKKVKTVKPEDIIKEIYDDPQYAEHHDIFGVATDNSHPGIVPNIMFSDFFIEWINNDRR